VSGKLSKADLLDALIEQTAKTTLILDYRPVSESGEMCFFVEDFHADCEILGEGDTLEEAIECAIRHGWTYEW